MSAPNLARKELNATEILSSDIPAHTVVLFGEHIGFRPESVNAASTVCFYETLHPVDGVYVTMTTANGNKPIATKTRDRIGDTNFTAHQMSCSRIRGGMFLSFAQFERQRNGVYLIKLRIFKVTEVYVSQQIVALELFHDALYHRDTLRSVPERFRALAEHTWRTLVWFKDLAQEADIVLRPKYCIRPNMEVKVAFFARTPFGTQATVEGQTYELVGDYPEGLYQVVYPKKLLPLPITHVQGIKLKCFTHTQLIQYVAKRPKTSPVCELVVLTLSNGCTCKAIHSNGAYQVLYTYGHRFRTVHIQPEDIASSVRIHM